MSGSDRGRATDRHARAAAIVLALTLPADTVMYLLLPIFAPAFGVTLPEAGVLLAANRLVRIAGYGYVVRFYNEHGSRRSCVIAVAMAALAAFGYCMLSGFLALLVLRVIWGIAFAFMNIATQVTATAEPEGAAERSGRSRAVIAFGPMVALPLAAIAAAHVGPRPVFFVLGLVSLVAFLPCPALPAADRTQRPGKRFGWPARVDVWSFVHGFALDGVFVFMLSLLAAASFPDHAALAAATALALRYFAEVFLAPLGGRMARRFGARELLLALSIGAGLALALVNASAGWIAVVVVVLLRGLMQPLPPPVAAALAPPEHRVMALANLATWRDVGAGLGPLVAGTLAGVWTPGGIYLAIGLMLAASALLLSAARRES